MDFTEVFKALNEALANKDIKIWCQQQEIINLTKKVEELEKKVGEQYADERPA